MRLGDLGSDLEAKAEPALVRLHLAADEPMEQPPAISAGRCWPPTR